MKNRLYTLCQKIISPITENPVFLSLVCLILLTPVGIQCAHANDVLYFLYAAPINIILAYFISAIELFSRKCVSLRAVSYIVVGIFSVCETFLVYCFGTSFSATIISLIVETNTEEAGGFVSSYLLTPMFAIFVLLLIASVAMIRFVDKRGRHLRVPCPDSFIILILGALVLSAGLLYLVRDIRFCKFFTIKDLQQVIHDKNQAFYSHNYTIIGNFIFQCYLYSLESNHTKYLKEFIHTGVRVSPAQKSSLVIFVIGEALNKYHSSLYGYALQTNPLLGQEKQYGNLYTFTDVIAPYNTTIKSLRAILFTSSNDTQVQWSHSPAFQYLFKQAGYRTYFISNQEVQGKNNDQWDLGNNYLVNPSIGSQYFDYQNSEKCAMDLELVNDYSPNIGDEASLIVYHLMGQHASYADRYPREESFFSVDCYPKEVPMWQKEIMVHYDNSVLYNDKVVTAIIDKYREHDCILIYFSDHGEEVCDYRDFAGRDLTEVLTPERAKYQFEVPFMIWMSDKYKENHPDVVAQVERSVNRPYMIDDLPHLMLDLAGIECEWFDPTRSVINDRFNAKRKRLLLDSKQDYDEIMKTAKHNGGL